MIVKQTNISRILSDRDKLLYKLYRGWITKNVLSYILASEDQIFELLAATPHNRGFTIGVRWKKFADPMF